jgi:hypothetical protein
MFDERDPRNYHLKTKPTAEEFEQTISDRLEKLRQELSNLRQIVSLRKKKRRL